MKTVLLFVLIGVAASFTIPGKSQSQRIVGGSKTTIEEYPMTAALLYSPTLTNYRQGCGGTIINNRSVLTATHCIYYETPEQWKIRVGSSFAHSGGTVHNVDRFIIYPFERYLLSADISILRTDRYFVFSDVVAQGSIPGPNYVAADNDPVWAVGWGNTMTKRPEQLHHVEVYVINEGICRERYGEEAITNNQICTGVLDVGGKDQCQGDSGGPVFHNNVVVGICSYGFGCASAKFPGVNTKVASFSTWVQENA